MKQLILLFVLIAILLSSCGVPSKYHYEIIFSDGHAEVVNYQTCISRQNTVECYKGDSYGKLPDIIYMDVVSVKRVDENP